MNRLDERMKKILWLTIQSHIDLNTPVGSIMIAKRFPLGLSSATIRNTMAKLEREGYITQPYTSAGRIPTEKGYRFYVNTLLDEHIIPHSPFSEEILMKFKKAGRENTTLIKEAAKSLSSFSKYLALAVSPKIENIVFHRIKFIKYEKKDVLILLISDENIVKHRIIELEKEYSQEQLEKASEYINNRFRGVTIKQVREKISYQLYKQKAICDELIANLLYICRDIIPSENDTASLNEFSGTSNLPDFASMKQIKGILKAIEEKHFMIKLLQQLSENKGTRVLVGLKDILPAMREFSMVVSTYNDNRHASGAIGIIGPTRMNYRKLIPAVDHTAKLLTKIMSEN